MEIDKNYSSSYSMADSVRKFYITEFPTDGLGNEIDPNATFTDVILMLARGEDVYDVLMDSIIRERVFSALTKIMGVEYSVLYDAWLEKRF